MKAKLSRFMYLVVIASCTILFLSCSKQDNVTASNPVTSEKAILSSENISVYAGKVINEILNNSIVSYMGYHKVITGNALSKSGHLLKINEYIDGYHIFEHSFVDPLYPDATSNYFLYKFQFKDGNGTVCRSPLAAASAYTYIHTTGKFGFVNEEPYGDKSEHIFEGVWSNLYSVPTLSGAGTYERWWTGLYSSAENEEDESDLTIHYFANINVSQLMLYVTDSTLSASGTIEVSLEGYRAVGTCSGASIMQITVYRGSEIFNTREVDISGRLRFLTYYLNLLNQ